MVTERTLALISLINSKNPDVMCFQEVRPEIYNILIKYLPEYKFHFPKKINSNYSCVIFSRFRITKCMNHDFKNSIMGRSLLVTKIDYPYNFNFNFKQEDDIFVEKLDVVVANTHFESLFKKQCINEKKIEQYKITRALLDELYNKYKNVIFCSDSNVLSHEEGNFNDIFDKNMWTDIWKVKGDENNKFTYDNFTNSHLIKRFGKSQKYQSRIDRILIKSDNCDTSNYEVIKSVNLIEPSDHYGVLGRFEVRYEV